MNHPLLLQRLAQAAQTLFVACLLTSLIACAPGTGGTGTGPIVNVLNSQLIAAGSSFGFAAAVSQGAPTATPGATPTLPSSSFNQLPACPALGVGQTRFTTTLSLSGNGIRYQQDCYIFTYQGSWEFDAALSLSIKGSVTQVLSASSPAQNASLQLRTSESLAAPAVQIRAVLFDNNEAQALPEQVLLPSTP